MKWIKRIIGILAGIFTFAVIVQVLNYMYVSEDDEWERILWHSFYENKGKIDNVYLGSSHVYCDIDPYRLDELMGRSNFNFATPAQRMNGTYYLLKEADRWNELSHVYVELYYAVGARGDADKEQRTTTNVSPVVSRDWRNADYMHFSINKLQYMMNMMMMADTEIYPNIFWGFSRYRAHLNDWNYVEATINRKRSREYINYQYHVDYQDGNGYIEFKQKGWCYSSKKFLEKERLFCQNNILTEDPMDGTKEIYLKKVITYCQARDIPITLFISPIYELQLISTEHYDYYLDQVRGIAAEYDVDFYDFNLTKEQYLPIQNVRYFMDVGHLNATGADLFTDFFYIIVSGNAEENRKYFYNSYEEKLACTAPEVYGIYYRDEPEEADGILYRSMSIASNRMEGMEYKVIMTPENGKEQYLVQDFSVNRTFRVDRDEHGICMIVYRMKNELGEVQTIEIAY